jgi:hypothetical protein
MAQRVEAIDRTALKPDQDLALLGALRLVADAAERERRRNRLVGCGGDGDSVIWLPLTLPFPHALAVAILVKEDHASYL